MVTSCNRVFRQKGKGKKAKPLGRLRFVTLAKPQDERESAKKRRKEEGEELIDPEYGD